jgi:hypothetical protein
MFPFALSAEVAKSLAKSIIDGFSAASRGHGGVMRQATYLVFAHAPSALHRGHGGAAGPFEASHRRALKDAPA